jgi:CRISPR-associated protein Cmr2
MPESVDWHELLRVWLHDPVDKALDIRSHEARAARYASRALGWDVTSREIRSSALPGDQLAAIAERLPMPTAGRRGERAVGLQDGKIAVRHPVSAQEDVLAGLALDENKVAETIDGIVASLPDDPRLRFLALWRLLPERLKGALARLPADTRVPDHTLIQHADIASGLWASHQSAQGGAYLSLSVGPVQSFIEAARSVRDLWSGSAMLSWLTFQGIRPVLEQLGPTALVYPALRGNPLMDMWLRDQGVLKEFPAKASLRAPSIPNRFVALVPYGPDGFQAKAIAQACDEAVRAAWQCLGDDVHRALDGKLSAINPDWARHWQEQVASFFDVKTSILYEQYLRDEQLACLIGGKDSFDEIWRDAAAVRRLAEAIPSAERPRYDQRSAGRWQAQLEVSARLMEAQRTIRHVPTGGSRETPSPPKCSLLGSYEQMGPSDLKGSGEFWKAASTISIDGVRLRPRERFCAVALCKRFAAPAFLAHKLHLKPADLRFPDTATVAAAKWLAEAGIDPDAVRREHGDWNGRWLHQKSRGDVEDDDLPPKKPIWQKIKAAKDAKKLGAPPTYYAILLMDADRMGEWLRGDKAPQVRDVLHPKMLHYYEQHGDKATAGLNAKRPVGPALHASISEALNNFASHVAPGIVKKYKGTMIYSGGDDVLALLPMRQAVACAAALRRSFRGEEDQPGVPTGWIERDGQQLLTMGKKATLSAGIAFVHHKEDLRLALQAARAAEKIAKDKGRDQLTLRFMRRSGARDEAILPWDQTQWFQSLVKLFAGDTTDRWAYRLYIELPTLQGSLIPDEAISAEIGRLVERTVETGLSGDQAKKWWADFYGAGRKRDRDRSDLLEHFTRLCQGASFVARGQDA